jgi:WD40 repeat protein
MAGKTTSSVAEPLDPHGRSSVPIERVFGELRFHTDGEVAALAFSAADVLWSVEEPGVLRRWNALTGQQLSVAFLSDIETGWEFSADARWLASASDELSLWDVPSGQLKKTLPQSSWVTAVAFSRDAGRVATGHDDGTIRVWNVDGEDLVCELAGHRLPISALAFSPDGSQIASAAEDRILLIWDVATCRQLGTLKGHTDRVQDLIWHPQRASRLVSAGWDTTARVWDTQTFQPVILLNDHADQVTALAYAPDGRLLACADSARAVHLWDAESGTTVGILKEHDGEIRALAFSPDGSYLASGGEDRVIHLWDPRQQRQLSGRGNPSLQRSGLALSSDGNRLVSNCGGAQLQVWDTATGRVVVEPEGSDFPQVIAYSSDNRWIAGGSTDNTIQLWDAATGKRQARLEGQKGRVAALAFSPDSRRLASASAIDGVAWLWSIPEGEPVLLIPEAADNCMVEALAFHPQGKLLAAGGIDWLATGGSDGATCLWDIDERCQIAALDGGILDMAFHPAGKLLATVSLDDVIFVWDIDNREVVLELVSRGDGLTRVAYSANGRWLAAGGDSGALRLWHADSGAPAARQRLETQIKALSFSPDGRYLYTGNGNTTSYKLELKALLAGNLHAAP